ncbi:uncharacterized protein BDR25DRAFT_366224 [Lindgomyces ingoldianus]|uniref:Uncharacterized protein n=1 Tax=Lindgomyces ingoldianus TaxID=673940 RepID=A0ACB6R2I6_9PLEO|nr:uncharacterized protein BDR25DRAFT_366224 [Lindgomyces ingoldianus]KAF2472990.1 hypothetical protein BDR25DRAFT_366224 [Lindgomyces ingoldianus]
MAFMPFDHFDAFPDGLVTPLDALGANYFDELIPVITDQGTLYVNFLAIQHCLPRIARKVEYRGEVDARAVAGEVSRKSRGMIPHQLSMLAVRRVFFLLERYDTAFESFKAGLIKELFDCMMRDIEQPVRDGGLTHCRRRFTAFSLLAGYAKSQHIAAALVNFFCTNNIHVMRHERTHNLGDWVIAIESLRHLVHHSDISMCVQHLYAKREKVMYHVSQCHNPGRHRILRLLDDIFNQSSDYGMYDDFRGRTPNRRMWKHGLPRFNSAPHYLTSSHYSGQELLLAPSVYDPMELPLTSPHMGMPVMEGDIIDDLVARQGMLEDEVTRIQLQMHYGMPM